uniref:F-box domain-containing protein n=1 Tax=Eutreptiella gymnastica TaxID=73025 RepID=A0A7S4CM42_9EUGL|mmetsp:Transcript_84575/g.141352  ORF Transcript_84575/g.141352 Transcript_84575/m.141352 type:complete len:443 (+) Transcript_84575:358-1686(+)|eukprot:CAMPEP_0174373242 /NCGR_PEP_ID=MMETSP0811_2-20130205/106351_1 /TAXON_ID=73025 ORGANISM="Eutreptiella gymnastica-like, Strain CCMP1594" /NCGR_SAMPLE_ID=MMETSP0811_2 /ASSEMBLY_ACC=CAM_ASM_000667 /LENGTH=442 /DNA_ID=CAMNT_0015521359 /DNA_START=358 /DNA_END=1686 /DNA_ORIENTATION=+
MGPGYHCQSSLEPLVDSAIRIPTSVSHTRSSSAQNVQYRSPLPLLHTTGDNQYPCHHLSPWGYPQRLPPAVQQDTSSSYPPAIPRKSLASQPVYAGPPVTATLYRREFRVPEPGYADQGFPGPIPTINTFHEGMQTSPLTSPSASLYGLGTSMPCQGVLGLGKRPVVTSIGRLPDDLLGVVFSLTPWEHFGVCGAVCGHWNRMVQLQANHNRKIAESLVAEGMQVMNTSNQSPKDLFERAIDICPQLASAAFGKAAHCQYARKAYYCMNKAFQFQLPFPTQPGSGLHKLIMFAFMNQGDDLSAKEVLEEALKWCPSDPELYDFLAFFHMNNLHYDEAIPYLNKALQLNYQLPRVTLFKRAMCFILTENPGLALEDLDKVLSMCPECFRALALKNSLERKLSNPGDPMALESLLANMFSFHLPTFLSLFYFIRCKGEELRLSL